MNRRDTLIAMTALGAMPWSAQAQQAGKVYRIGYLSAPTRAAVENALQAFLRALRQLGWIDGQNLVIEYRWADGKIERLPEMAADLVQRRVDLIVAPAAVAALAAKGATSSIPIVMIFPNDPVALGLVASLRRPGANITGTTSSHSPEIYGKQLQLLKEMVPHASRVARLFDPTTQLYAAEAKAVESAAQALRLRLQQVPAHSPDDFEKAFADMAAQRAEALVVSTDTPFLVHKARIAELALKHRLPTMYTFREHVEAGGLMAYSVNMADFIGRSANYVDRILKGANPAELPVEQPTAFELVINAKTARALGLTIPRDLLLRADEVIQ